VTRAHVRYTHCLSTLSLSLSLSLSLARALSLSRALSLARALSLCTCRELLRRVELGQGLDAQALLLRQPVREAGGGPLGRVARDADEDRDCRAPKGAGRGEFVLRYA